MALQYLSHNMSQVINGVVRVFPVTLDDNETTVGRASNVQKGSHNIQRAVGASSNTSGSIHSSSQGIIPSEHTRE